MARTSATISVGADTRQLERDIQRALGRDFKFKGLNEKAFTQPLGRITGAANEFQKSLDASNARVIAFGASAGLIFAVERAFTSLVRSTIDVQKSLTDINVILNVSTKSLQNFGSGLFNIAKDTAQSFDTVAQAATEFSRQGLGLEETLKRTRDALILTRLSGLDTVASVEALTATINSFSNAALDSTIIINKLANVDAAFAVSSADLAEAIKRVGSSAQDVGVDFDQLLAIVTSVQQTTARGGSVIGNSLKTIFTRIQRTDTLDALEELGIQVRTLEGETLPAIQVLSNLANTFGTLGDAQRSQVAELVGGVFQINILKAALADLGKEFSVYNNALNVSASSTNEAIARNEALNQTLSSLINKTFVNLTKAASDIGRISFQPTFENLLNLLNKGLEQIDVESQTVGGKIGKGILEGIGQFISGPGVILATAVIGKLLLNLGKFASQSLQTLLNLNTQAEQRAQIQTKINQVLAQEPNLVQAVYNKQISVLDVENKILNIIRQQTVERQRAAALATTLAGGLVGRGVTTKGGSLSAKSQGFIPNFAMSEIFGALAGGYNPGNIKRMNIPGEGEITYNSAEKVKRFPGFVQPAIMPPIKSKAGKKYKDNFSSIYGFNPYASEGFIPNFIGPATVVRNAKITSLEQAQKYKEPGTSYYNINGNRVSQAQLEGVLGRSAKVLSTGVLAGKKIISASTGADTLTGEVTPGFPGASYLVPRIGVSPRVLKGPFSPKGLASEFAVSDIPVHGINKGVLQGDLNPSKTNLFENIKNSLLDLTAGYIKTLDPFGRGVTRSEISSGFQKESLGGAKGAYGALKAVAGSAFEVAMTTASDYTALKGAKNQGDFDIRGGNLAKIKKLFNFNPTHFLADFKSGVSKGNVESFANKIFKEVQVSKIFTTAAKRKKSAGFIPNFAALDDAINRELIAGVSPNRVRIGKDRRLTSASNPLGLGVYNTKDEPLGLGQGIARYGSKAKKAGAADGFIPNFVAPAAAFLANPKTLLAISFLLPQVLGAVQQLVGSETRLGKGIEAASTAISFALAGSIFGKGAGILTTIIGVALGLKNLLEQGTNVEINKLTESIQNNKDILQNFSSAATDYATSIEKLKSEEISDNERQQLLTKSNEALATILENTPEKLREGFKVAIESGNFNKINDKIGEIQSSLQINAINTENLANIMELTKDKQLTGDELNKFTAAILDLRTESGKSVRTQVLERPELKRQFEEDLSNAFEALRIRAERQSGMPAEIAVQRSGVNAGARGGLFGGLFGAPASKTFAPPPEEFLAEERAVILQPIRNFLSNAGVASQKIDEIGNEIMQLTFTDVDNLSKGLQEVFKKFGVNIKNIDEELKKALTFRREDILRRAGLVGDVSKFEQASIDFAKVLDKEALEGFSKTVLDADKNLKANRIVAGKVLDAQTNIYQSILNETERRNVNAKFIEQTNNLLQKGVKDLDKFVLAVQGTQEELIALNQRARGLMFAEDFRGARQTARENRILGGETKLEDFPAAFFDEFDYRTEDSFREAQLGAKETARTIKSEFNNAFLSFAKGTETASDAFTKMALNISDKIQQLALEFATNQIFGSLFGSTSSMFGGGGGGIFSGLFGKSKGGIIKGYASGGKVSGGSGTKDDIPAMLSKGEYVIRKSAVNKYGLGLLDMLNNGKVSKFAYGGGTSFIEKNIYENDSEPIYIPETGQTIYMPKNGRISAPELSIRAILDPTNPQNQVRNEAEQRYYDRIRGVQDYLAYVDDVRKANAEAYAENQRLNKEIRDQYNKQKSAASRGAWMTFGLGLLGAGANQFSSMGGFKGLTKGTQGWGNWRGNNYSSQSMSFAPPGRVNNYNLRGTSPTLRGYAKGGSAYSDNVPALLMDGEFIMRKEAVNLYGKRFFDNLNTGRIKKFAQGGEVGNPFSTSEQSESYSPTNNVNITINLNGSSDTKNNEMDRGKSEDKEKTYSDAKGLQDLGIKIRNEVMKVITEQQRPGGLLRR